MFDDDDNEEYVLVPKSDLVKLEKARLELHEIVGDGIHDNVVFSNVFQKMWYLTHRKYMKDSIGRNIVANLLRRKRFASKLLRGYVGDNEDYRTILISNYTEAHNAYEASNRILYGNEP